MENILVSACMLGVKCKYDGTDNYNAEVIELMKYANLVPCCGEIMGGLPTPRPAAERFKDRVITVDGGDVTDQFVRGAREVCRIAGLYHCRYAVLKERSPSCGYGTIYDGSFQHKRIAGSGVTAQLLAGPGLVIGGESRLDWLKSELTAQKKER